MDITYFLIDPNQNFEDLIDNENAHIKYDLYVIPMLLFIFFSKLILIFSYITSLCILFFKNNKSFMCQISFLVYRCHFFIFYYI